MLIEENELDTWVRGNAEKAQGLIVELICRLVAAASPKPKNRRFPRADSIGQRGPDGILDALTGFDPYFPEGQSLWEIGTGVKAGGKATSDYTALTTDVPQDVRAESTFIFVTPLSGRRDWEHTWKPDAQATWIEERKARSEWRDVRVIDGTKLVEWINQFPAIAIWLAGEIKGIPKTQIETPEQRWNLVRTIGQPPPLIPEVFLANRELARQAVDAIFEGTRTHLKLTTHFPNQVSDFVAAHIATLREDIRIDATGRCLIVSGEEAWTTLSTPGTEKLILIADPALDLSGDLGTKLLQKARTAGHATIIGGAQGGIPNPTAVVLPPPKIRGIQDALVKAGYPEERGRILAQKSDGNIEALMRCLQNMSTMPEWAESNSAAELAIAVALGGWNEKFDLDKGVIEGLSGNAYGEWIRKAREAAGQPGTPLKSKDGRWEFNSRFEGWHALGPRLFDEHLDRFLKAVLVVLGEKDPQFDLPTEERYAAAIHGKTLSHSKELRNGLAEGLALLGSYPQALQRCSRGKAEGTAIIGVRKLLADADWVTWVSLNNFLPLLAEAAPSEFLSIIEAALGRSPCPFDEIFSQESSGVMGRTYTSGLLWALETLAWNPDHLGRVSLCLAELAARDPGGNWANRPANSLKTIFLPWLPQTCASIPQRIAAAKSFIKEQPDVGWKFLLELLPGVTASSSGSRKPAWRNWIPEDWSYRPRESEEYLAYAALSIELAKGNLNRTIELISEIDKIYEPVRGQFLEHLSSDGIAGLPDQDKYKVWEELTDFVSRHKKFSDAEWAAPPDELAKIVAIAKKVEPTIPHLRHKRLFGNRDFALFEEKGNYARQQEKLDTLRLEAVREISKEGPRAVIGFSESIESPGAVGYAYGTIGENAAEMELLPALLTSTEKTHSQLIGGFVWGRFRSLGWEWIDQLDTSKWTADQLGQLLAFLPFTEETWKRATILLGKEESAYWTRVNPNPFAADAGLEHAISRLLENGRGLTALRCLSRILHDKLPLDPALAIRVLIGILDSKEDVRSMDRHEIQDVIRALQSEPKTNLDDLFNVEWAFIKLLSPHDKVSPLTIESRLASDPKFFCEIIRLVFKSTKTTSPEPTDAQKKIASNAYELLSNWRVVPGSNNNGGLDAELLKKWLAAAKEECAATGHLEIALTMIGQVLIHAPTDPDGLWIHRAAASVLDDKDAQDMRDGYRTEVFNSRGAHWVDPTGKPERELAERFQRRANEIETAGFPRLAATLRELATGYQHEAERVISDAEDRE